MKTTLLLLLSVLSLGATDAQFNFRLFTPGTNTIGVVVTPSTAPTSPDGVGIVLGDAQTYRTGTNGILTISNMAPMVYRVDAIGPRTNTTLYVSIPDTNVLINAWSHLSTRPASSNMLSGYTTSAADARFQRVSEKGQTNGYASLGADGKVPASQIPILSVTNVDLSVTNALLAKTNGYAVGLRSENGEFTNSVKLRAGFGEAFESVYYDVLDPDHGTNRVFRQWDSERGMGGGWYFGTNQFEGWNTTGLRLQTPLVQIVGDLLVQGTILSNVPIDRTAMAVKLKSGAVAKPYVLSDNADAELASISTNGDFSTAGKFRGSGAAITNAPQRGLGLLLWSGTSEPAARDEDDNDFAAGVRYYGSDPTFTNIIALWEHLRTNAWDGWTVTRTEVSKDESGVYPVWLYAFTPREYDRTVLVTSGWNGGETGSALALWRFMFHAITAPGNDAALRSLRTVRLLVFPWVNPWGRDNDAYGNSTGEYPNYNFPWGWDASTSDYKGAAALDQAEAAAVYWAMTNYTLHAYVGMHDYGLATNLPYAGYMPQTNLSANIEPAYAVSKFMAGTNTVIDQWFTTSEPEAYNTAASLGINAVNPESGVYSNLVNFPYQGTNWITEATKWYGNILLAYAQWPALQATPTVSRRVSARIMHGDQIGNTNQPRAKLHLLENSLSASGQEIARFDSLYSAGAYVGSGPYMSFKELTTGQEYGRIANTVYDLNNVGLSFHTFDASLLLERMRLTGHGELQLRAPENWYADDGSKAVQSLWYNGTEFGRSYMGSSWQYNIASVYPAALLQLQGQAGAKIQIGSDVVLYPAAGGRTLVFGGALDVSDSANVTNTLRVMQGSAALGQGLTIYLGTNRWDVQNDGDAVSGLDFIGNGTNRLHISNTGHVGIDTSAPPAKLTLNQSGNDLTDGLRLNYGETYWDILTDSPTYGGLWIGGNGTNRLYLSHAGALGLNTNSVPAGVSFYVGNGGSAKIDGNLDVGGTATNGQVQVGMFTISTNATNLVIMGPVGVVATFKTNGACAIGSTTPSSAPGRFTASSVYGASLVASAGTVTTSSSEPTVILTDATSGDDDWEIKANNDQFFIQNTSTTAYGMMLNAPSLGFVQWVGGTNIITGTNAGSIVFSNNLANDGSPTVAFLAQNAAGNCNVYVQGNIWALGTISGETVTDRSAAPGPLEDAYAIVRSVVSDGTGRVDHSKLHPLAWGRTVVQVPTGKLVTNTVAAVKDEDGKEVEPAKTVVSAELRTEVQPDQTKRDLGMVISAQAMVITDLEKRLATLEKAQGGLPLGLVGGIAGKVTLNNVRIR